MGVKRFTDLRAWQACVTYKRAIYRLVLQSPLCGDWKRRDQLEGLGCWTTVSCG